MIIAGPISGSGGNLQVDGPGLLVINGTNANVVTITVTNGNLEIGANGLVQGAVVVTNNQAGANNGTLKLDSPTALKSTATLSIHSSLAAGSVNLNFSGTNTIFAYLISGVSQPAGVYGPTGSGAQFESAVFSGSGFL